jgi:hypothetical protein
MQREISESKEVVSRQSGKSVVPSDASIKSPPIEPPKVKVNKNENGTLKVTPVGDPRVFSEQLKTALGSSDVDLANNMLKQLSATLPGQTAGESNFGLAVLHGIAPNDTLEGLLATQMLGVHNLSVDFMSRIYMNKDVTLEMIDRYVSRITKLSNLFISQMAALTKYRNRGQQHVTVQHLAVHGGQTIVGAVNHTPSPPPVRGE